jgi:hypothetical protein
MTSEIYYSSKYYNYTITIHKNTGYINALELCTDRLDI